MIINAPFVFALFSYSRKSLKPGDNYVWHQYFLEIICQHLIYKIQIHVYNNKMEQNNKFIAIRGRITLNTSRCSRFRYSDGLEFDLESFKIIRRRIFSHQQELRKGTLILPSWSGNKRWNGNPNKTLIKSYLICSLILHCIATDCVQQTF